MFGGCFVVYGKEQMTADGKEWFATCAVKSGPAVNVIFLALYESLLSKEGGLSISCLASKTQFLLFVCIQFRM